MLRLYINDTIVHLNPNSSLKVKMRNPAFNGSGTFSYPFSLSRERNRALLSNLDAEDNFEEVVPTFKLYIDDELFIEGDVVIQKNNTSNFQAYLKAGKSSAVRILKESYLDGTINGESWGDAPGGLSDINASPNDVYPTNKFTVAPIQLNDYVINEWDVESDQLVSDDIFTGKITPMVYGRHLIDRINQALSFFVPRNDFTTLEDFKRWCIFAPRKGNDAANGLTRYAEWLPHITASEFLEDLEQRFNIIAFFTPLLRQVDYIKFDTILSGNITDWSKYYVGDNNIESFKRGRMLLKNDGDDDQILSPQEIEQKYDFVEVPTYANVDTINPSKVLDVDRYFIPEAVDFENPITKNLYVDTVPIFVAERYNLIESPDVGTEEETNGTTTAGQENRITEFYLYDVNEGDIYDNLRIFNIEARNNGATNMDVIAKVEIYDRALDQTEVLGQETITLTSTSYNFFNFDIKLYKTGSWEMLKDKDNAYINGTYLRIVLYAYNATTAGAATVRFGAVSPPGPVLPYTLIIADSTVGKITEINPISTLDFGDADAEKVETIEPSGKVLYNVVGNSDQYYFQMPTSDIDPELEQGDYAHTIYRGKITDERDGSKRAPYCNFDVLDLEMADYQSRVTVGATPDLSLRWHGNLGLGEQLWRQRLIWFRNYHRPVRKLFSLSLHDLLKLRMYERVRVENVTYIINEVSFSVDVNGDLSTAEVEMFTV